MFRHLLQFVTAEFLYLIPSRDHFLCRSFSVLLVQVQAKFILVASVAHVTVLALRLHILLVPPSTVLRPRLKVSRVYLCPMLGLATGIAIHIACMVRILLTDVLAEVPVEFCDKPATWGCLTFSQALMLEPRLPKCIPKRRRCGYVL